MRNNSQRSLIGSAIVHVAGIGCLVLFKIAFPPQSTSLTLEAGFAQNQSPPDLRLFPESESTNAPVDSDVFFENSVSTNAFLVDPSANINFSGNQSSNVGLQQAAMTASQQRFDEVVSGFAENGLDLVVVFDSTSSMREEIDDLKENLADIAKTLFAKLPKTRISVVFYRDLQDTVSVGGLPFCKQPRQIARYLTRINASGGGKDLPEDVRLGLQTAIEGNMFRPKAHKVILLFGDAAPHDVRKCRFWVSHFRRSLGGRVSTITCGQPEPLPTLVDLADSGGGESIVLSKNQRVASELSLLLFGKENRNEARRFLAN